MMRGPLAVVAGAVAGLSSSALGCTIVAVGKDASATGHPIVCHTDDSGPDTTDVRFVRVPRRQWPEGSTRKLYHWVDGYPRVVSAERSPEYAPVGDQKESFAMAEIPQVPETYAYWDTDYGIHNEVGLSIGESTCTGKTVGWPATPDRPYGYNHAGIDELSKIALERCATALCAVELMGKLAVELGFYSADSGFPDNPDYEDSAEALIVGDTEELWVFNVLTGKNNASAIWAAKRIPSDHVAAVGNSFTIRKMNLSDSENFRYSPGVTELAEEMGWWSPEDDEPGVFDFFRAYGWEPDTSKAKDEAEAKLDEEVIAFYSGRRMWRVFSLLSPAEGAKLDPNRGNLPSTKNPYPASVPAPRGSITVRQLMGVLRDHYEGTPYDLTAGMAAGPFGNPNRGPVAPWGTKGMWERAISMHRSTYTYLMEARPNGTSVVWFGYDAPHGTAYLPFFGAAAEGAPEAWHSHEGCMSKFSEKVAWWAFNMVNQYTDINFQLINKDVRAKSKAIEDEGEEMVAKCMAKAEKESREEAAKTLAKCSNDFATEKLAEWWEFAYSLFAKYGRYSITTNETERGMDLMVYPEWWLSSAEVGFTMWTASGPYHGVPDPAVITTPWWMAAVPTAAGSSAAAPLLALAVSAAVGAVGFQLGKQQGLRIGGPRDEGYMSLAA